MGKKGKGGKSKSKKAGSRKDVENREEEAATEETENSEEEATPSSPTEPNWKDLYDLGAILNKGYEEQITNFEGQVTELQSRLDEEEARKKSYEEQSTTFEGQVAELQRRLDEEEARKKSYEEQITKFQAEATKFHTKVAELQRHLHKEKQSTESETKVKEELGRRFKELKADYEKLGRAREREKKKAALECAEHAKEKDELRAEIEDLHVMHIKSVNNIGTGLDPITDQTFRERLVTLHAKVEDWCRSTFTAKSETRVRAINELDCDIAELLPIRVINTKALSIVRLMESLFWGYAEERILSAWFPAMPPKNLQQMSILEENIRFGDNSVTYERADFWRAYTTSLLFQNQQVQSRLNAVNIPATELSKLLSKVQVTRRLVAETPLRDLLHCVMHLAAQLRCQRGVYEVDDNIHLGDRYDDERMFDLENPDLKETDDAKHARVRAIVSKGVVWKSFTGSGAIVERICKARVLVITCRSEGDSNTGKGEGYTNEIMAVTGTGEGVSKDIATATGNGQGETTEIVVVTGEGVGDSEVITC